MKESLAHLPERKRSELARIVGRIREMVADIRMIILITKKQLEYLAQRVKKLQRLTNKICKEKIESFG